MGIISSSLIEIRTRMKEYQIWDKINHLARFKELTLRQAAENCLVKGGR